MAALILFGGFFGLLALRVPVAFALGLSALPILLIEPRLSAYTLVQERSTRTTRSSCWPSRSTCWRRT